MLIFSLDWSSIIAAAIISLPACVGAAFAGINYRRLRTPSGRPMGELTEETHTLTSGELSEQVARIGVEVHEQNGGTS